MCEFGQPMTVENLDIAAPGPGEVSVQVKACAICHSDILYACGACGGELPAVYGHEAAGVVETVGAGVSHVQPGDHVVVTLVRSCGCCGCCDQGFYGSCESGFALDQNPPLRLSAAGSLVTHGLGTTAFDELISGRYQLTEINAAIAAVERGEALRNVIVF